MSAPHWPGSPDDNGAPRGAASPPIAPPLPVAKRLNRNALTVAAVLMGITVLVAVVTLNTKRPAGEAKAGAEAAVSTKAQPSFLDLPARRDIYAPSDAPRGTATIDTSLSPPATPRFTGSGMRSYPDPYAVPGSIPYLTDPAPEAYHRALISPVLPAAFRSAKPPGTLTVPSASSGPSARETAAGGGAVPVIPAVDSATPAVTIAPRIVPSSPYRIDAGTVIPAAIIRAINSDLPGHLVAQVTRHVYDSRTLHTVLIPQGTKLLGRYNAEITAGQNRLQIV